MSLKSDDAYAAQLQAILRISQSLREVAAVSLPLIHSPSIPNQTPPVIDLIRLPSPSPLLSSLLETGVGHEIASTASRIYLLRAEELRQHIQESILATWHKIAELPVIAHAMSPDFLMRKVVSISTGVYLRRLEQWKEDIVRRIKQTLDTPSKASSKNAFNHDYVPLLEHFFEENPFPTHADKVFLAKKSNMQYRQIHVWFQNRRNRTKKEGKTLRRKPTHEGATKPLDKLYERMKGHIVNSDSHVRPSQSASSEGTIETEVERDNPLKDTIVSSSPPHAFPSPYPPACHYDPFPCKSGPVCFSSPEWRRVPCGKPPLPSSTSVDDLVERFSHLNVRDDTHSREAPNPQSNAATVAITVIPSRAPHPSLIPRKYFQPVGIVQLRPSVRTPVSRSRSNVFQNPSPTSKPVTLVPPLVSPKKSEFPWKRKTVPLPQHSPGRMRNTCRDATSSENSPSPCLFSTDTESRSSSSSTSPLSTPSDVANVQELRHSFGSPCRLPSDSPIHLHSLGDIVASSVS